MNLETLFKYAYDIKNESIKEAIHEWELALFDEVGQTRYSPELFIYFFGTEYSNDEVAKVGALE
jgi:hypothetical protein